MALNIALMSALTQRAGKNHKVHKYTANELSSRSFCWGGSILAAVLTLVASPVWASSSDALPELSGLQSVVPPTLPSAAASNPLYMSPIAKPRHSSQLTNLPTSPLGQTINLLGDVEVVATLLTTPNLPSGSTTLTTVSPEVSSFAQPVSFRVTSDAATAKSLDQELPMAKPSPAYAFEMAQATRFTDIKGHWAESFIQALANQQVVVGFPDGSFRPDSLLTRAQYASMMQRAFQLSPASVPFGFVDLPKEHWGYRAVQSAYRAGFFQDVTGNTFGPEQGLTRSRTLALLSTGLRLNNPANSEATLITYFRDAEQIPGVERGPVAAAAANQMVVGYPDTTLFRPSQLSTRAEAASSIHQALVQSGRLPEIASAAIARPMSRAASQPSPTATTPAAPSVDAVQSRLQRYQEADNFGNIFRGSPGITIANPPAYGADDNMLFTSISFQSRTRFTSKSDGAIGVGIGLFDALNVVGLEVSYTAASFGNSRPFGAGGFNVKLHRSFEGDFAIAAGWNGIVTVDDPFGDFKDSYYGVVTKIFRTAENVTDPFSRVAITAGFGGGQFRPIETVTNNGVPVGSRRTSSVGVFGSFALRVADPVTAIVEWTGQDLAVGLSLRPIQGVSWTITPAVRDLAGSGLDGARFVLGTSFSIKF